LVVPVHVAAGNGRYLRIPVVQFVAHVCNSSRPLRRAGGGMRKISLVRDSGSGVLALARPQVCGGWYTERVKRTAANPAGSAFNPPPPALSGRDRQPPGRAILPTGLPVSIAWKG
jgi:hypothetical protein